MHGQHTQNHYCKLIRKKNKQTNKTKKKHKKMTRLRLEEMDVQCTWVQQHDYCRVVPKINRVVEM